MTGSIEQWLKPDIVIPLINTSVIITACRWFTKSYGDINNRIYNLNKDMNGYYDKFKEDFIQIKNEEVNNIKAGHEVEKKEIAITLQAKDNEINDLKRKIEYMEDTSTTKAVENLLSVKKILEQTIEELKNEKNIPDVQEKIDNIQTNIDNQIANLQQSVNKYARRMENSIVSARWIEANTEDILAEAQSNIQDVTKEEVDSFIQDIKGYLKWICDSLTLGDYEKMYEVGISTKIPTAKYENVFQEIRNKGRKQLHENVVKELEYYLDYILKSISR